MSVNRLRRPAAIALVLLVASLSACSNSRPTVDEWLPLWDQAVALIPSQAELGDPPSEDLCEQVLVNLREVSVDLALTPEETLDAAVDAWIGVAEQAFFECPPEEGEISNLDEAYEEMAQLQTEIDALVASQR